MAKVEYNMDSLNKCLCPECPVQQKSKCVKRQLDSYHQAVKEKGEPFLPDPAETPGVYCSTGKARCDGLVRSEQCICPNCQVWAENNLHSMHYCFKGSADEIETS